MTIGRGRSLGELIRDGERSFSFEFMPPKDEAGEAQGPDQTGLDLAG